MLPTDTIGRVRYLKLAGPDICTTLRRAALALELRSGSEDFLRQALGTFVAKLDAGANRNPLLAIETALEVIESGQADPATCEWLVDRIVQFLPLLQGDKWSYAFSAAVYAPRGSALEEIATTKWEDAVAEELKASGAPSVIHLINISLAIMGSRQRKGIAQPDSLFEERALAIIERLTAEMKSEAERGSRDHVIALFQPRQTS
jgi:hypothetical protein